MSGVMFFNCPTSRGPFGMKKMSVLEKMMRLAECLTVEELADKDGWTVEQELDFTNWLQGYQDFADTVGKNIEDVVPEKIRPLIVEMKKRGAL